MLTTYPTTWRSRLAGRARGARFWEVDAARGVAILMMALYHLLYDLAAFGDYEIQVSDGFWQAFGNVSAVLFLALVGVSLTLSYARAARPAEPPWHLYPKYLRRGVRVLAYGLVITAVTWVFAPERFIRFGILHLIGLGIILAYPLVGRPWSSLSLGLVVIALGPILRPLTVDGPWLLWLGIRPDEFATLDYRPLVPWFGVILLGVAAGHLLYARGRRRFALPDWSCLPVVRPLAVLGRYSLLFYLVHQPLLLAVLALLGIIDLGL